MIVQKLEGDLEISVLSLSLSMFVSLSLFLSPSLSQVSVGET